MKRRMIRATYHLADRINHAAEIARNADHPRHLNHAKKLILRNLARLNHIKDYWSDHLPATRGVRCEYPPFLHQKR